MRLVAISLAIFALTATPKLGAQTLAPSRLRNIDRPTGETVDVKAKAPAQYVFKAANGRNETVPIISNYYSKQLVQPFARVDRHIDPKLLRAATIAEDRAHAHSRSRCWHYVKDALLASGVVSQRPKSEYARDAGAELVSSFGFRKLPVSDPFAAPIGSVLVYGTGRTVGHVELRTRNGFVSDFRSPTPSHRPLIGVYAKL